MATLNFGGVRELSAVGTVREVGRSYVRNALPWCGLAAAISALGALLPLLTTLSEFVAESPSGAGRSGSFVLSIGVALALLLIVGCLHKVTAYALLSANASFSASASEEKVSGLETKQTMRFFAEAFICAALVVIAAFAALLFLASVVPYVWVYALLIPLVPAAYFVVLVATDTEQGVIRSTAQAWKTARNGAAYGLGCFVPALVLAAIAAWLIIAVDLHAVWTQPEVHIALRLGTTFATLFVATFLAVQPIALLSAFVYRRLEDVATGPGAVA